MSIGNGSTYFTGKFHEHGHLIKNLFISNPPTDYVGLFGYSSGTIDSVGMSGGSVTGSCYVGGIVGYTWTVISNCYNTGSVSVTSNVGGDVGQNANATISNCYWDKNTTGQTTGSGTGLTTAQMKQSSNFNIF